MNVDLTKCNCTRAGFCEIYKKEMDTAGVNWCKHTSKEKRESYATVNNPDVKFCKSTGPQVDTEVKIKTFKETKSLYKISNLKTHKKNDKSQDFQIVVKSFMRHHYLLRLIKSVRKWYPNVEILIVDDSKELISEEYWSQIEQFPGVKFWHTEFDIGLAEGRNLLSDLASKKYIVNCDDDFIFTKETKIEDLIKVIELKDENFDVCCGVVRMDGSRITDWSGNFTFKESNDGTIFQVSEPESDYKWVENVPYRKVDFGLNFFLAKTEVLKANKNDPRFKIAGEHLDKFIDWKEKGIRVAQCPSCVAGHSKEDTSGYIEFRNRNFHDLLLKKYNFKNSPVHRPTIAPYDSNKNSELEAIKQLMDRPNIVLLTVGHTGSSVVSSMLGKLGWNLCDADEEYSESVSIRNANINNLQAKELIECLEEPWVIKDPRFCEYLDLWKPFFDEDVLLLWLTKDLEKVKESYERRNQNSKKAEIRQVYAEEHFRRWVGPKLKIDYDQIKEAVKLFRID